MKRYCSNPLVNPLVAWSPGGASLEPGGPIDAIWCNMCTLICSISPYFFYYAVPTNSVAVLTDISTWGHRHPFPLWQHHSSLQHTAKMMMHLLCPTLNMWCHCCMNHKIKFYNCLSFTSQNYKIFSNLI